MGRWPHLKKIKFLKRNLKLVSPVSQSIGSLSPLRLGSLPDTRVSGNPGPKREGCRK